MQSQSISRTNRTTLTVGDQGESGILGQTDPTQNPVIRLRFSSVESWAEETVVEIHPPNPRHQNLRKQITENVGN